MKKSILACAAMLSFYVAAADSSSQPEKPGRKAVAVAVLSPLGTNTVHGIVNFFPAKNGVRIRATVEGLTPGVHGFHIHEKGDCSAADGTSAGGHFNPDHAEHGGPNAEHHHAGDFGNLEANKEGVAKFDHVFSWLTLSGPDSILGKGMIVHGKPDDLKTQPTGNAGSRVACGVIQSTSK